MLQKFWEALGTKLAERWVAATAPALLFWASGLLAWLYGHGDVGSITDPKVWILGQPGLVQVGFLLAILLLLVASVLLVERLSVPTLRLLEGYWPRPFRRLRRQLVAREEAKVAALEQRWSELRERLRQEIASPDERQEAIELDAKLLRFPALSEQMMPTRIGNILRAAESRPTGKYGLDTVACWPHLWLLVPDAARQELATASSRLQAAVNAAVWSALLLGFAAWTWWAVPTAVAATAVIVRIWVTNRAEVLADLIEATVDLHRPALYQALRWPLPTDPDDERSAGQMLTEYLRRGLSGPLPQFTKPEH
jgi:hypothetical protein